MKFKIVKHFPLDFLGVEWKEAFIDFEPFTIKDVRGKLPEIANLQTKDADVVKGLDTVVDLLKEKFITGKVLDEKGELVSLKGEDIIDFPLDVIGRAFSFLSQTEIKTS